MDWFKKEDKINKITVISENDKSVVWLASDCGSKLLIVKELLGADKTRLYGQIKESNSSYFPDIYEVACVDGNTWVIEEYVEGEELQEKLKEDISPEQGMKWMIQLLEAVAVLHSLNPPLIHRDIKPENILVTADGAIKLLDFDASRVFLEDDKERDTRLLGTKGYASPEQFGFSQTDFRSDIYSAGIVCSEILSKMELNKQATKQMRMVVDRATMFDPDRRFQTAEEMLGALKKTEKVLKRNAAWKYGVVAVVALAVSVVGIVVVAGKNMVSVFGTSAATENILPGGINTPVSPEPAKICNWDILPAGYNFVRIMEYLRKQAFYKPGMGKQEEFVFIYHKQFPQALMTYEFDLENCQITSIILERYTNDRSKLIESFRVFEKGKCILRDGMLCLTTALFEDLSAGQYVIKLYDNEECVCRYPIEVVGEDGNDMVYGAQLIHDTFFYSVQHRNDIFVNVLNTPYTIDKIYCNEMEIAIEAADVILTEDSKGVVLKATFFETCEKENYEFTIWLKDGSNVTFCVNIWK